MKKVHIFLLSLLVSTIMPASQFAFGQSVLTPEELLGIERYSIRQLSPDGTELIYSISTPRSANEKPGGAHTQYFRMNLMNKESVPLFEQGVKGSSPRYSPDGSHIAFIKKQKGISQVWVMPAEGGELVQLTDAKNNVKYFRWQPDGKGIAYLAVAPMSAKEIELKKRGYGFIFYEENLKNNELYVINFDPNFKPTGKKQLLQGIHVWDFEFSPDGKWLAFSSSEKNLIDHRYMFRKLQILDISSGDIAMEVGNAGKLGNYIFNQDGSQLAYASALNMNDHAVSQAFTYSLKENTIKNHTPPNFKGHISWVGWKNNTEILCYSGEGVYPKLSGISIESGQRSVMLDAGKTGVIFGEPLSTDDHTLYVFTGNTPYDPSNIYTWKGAGSDLNKITDLNPQLQNTLFGEQEVIQFTARDGKEIEGLLIKPVGYDDSKTYPLIMYVHGGPESHYSNGWLSRYSRPGQVLAGKGYMVAYLNYRASTGYGVDFAIEGFMDPAGKEFDDLADGIDYLVAEKGADKERVGMAGGSYGGYASAWFATYYTDYVKAVCMFVGVSDLISKRGTTDIAYEELYVHSGKPLEEQWQMNLERSPIYWAHQSKTATLIYGGADDPRVHPTQSLEMYRRMKMNNHPAVRLVQYPGEKHGNRKQVGRIDVLYRQIDWLDWYVKDLKPLDGQMPPLDISHKYGLDWELE